MNDLKGIIEDCNKSDLVSDKVIKKIIEIIGQEKWQDINDEKSDICTTTGELIITLKGIVELEKENAELKNYRLTTLAKQQTGMSKYALNLEHKLSWYDDQLTKAKEIIKELMSFSVQLCDCRHTVDFEKTREEAEQFLNSEVEK